MKLEPFLYLFNHPPIEGLCKEDSPVLNKYQSLARLRNGLRGDNMADKTCLLQGTPGARKIRVIDIAAVNSLRLTSSMSPQTLGCFIKTTYQTSKARYMLPHFQLEKH